MSEGKDQSRREFMTGPLVCLTSTGLVKASGKLRVAEAVLTENAANARKVILTRLPFLHDP